MGFLLSRFGMMAMALVIALGGYQYWKVHQRNIGKQIAIEKSTKELGKVNEKAKANRDRVNADDKFFSKRMLDYCRDCK